MRLRRLSRPLWLLIALIVLAAAARLYRIQTQSIWFDEGWSAYAAVQPTLAAAIAADPTNPPLYYLLLNIAARGFGDSTFALRWFSALAGLLVMPLVYRLGCRLFDTRAGVWSAFLAGFSPLLWWASQEARMYTLLAVLVTAAALAFHRLLERPARWVWAALWAAEVALLYAHNTGPVAALWLNAAALLAWALYRRPNWRLWLAGQVVVGLLWLPWFITRFLLLQEANSAVTSAPPLDAALLARMWESLWAGSWSLVGQETVVSALAAALLVLALLLIPWRKPAARWLVGHAALLSGGLLLGLAILGNDLHGRYLVMVTPLLLAAIGAGLGGLRLRWSAPAAGFFLAAFVAAVFFVTTGPAYQHDDVRGMVRYYADALAEDDTVLAWSYADRYDLWYYWERLGVKARRVTLPEGADLETVLPLLPESGDVALNIWYTQRADYRGMMGCLLANGTINPPEVFTVYGMSSQLYRASALNLPELRPFEAISGPARVVAVGGLPSTTADRALCLPVQITLLQDLDADLKAAIIVQNGLGWEVARADAIFADAAQRTGSALPVGSALAAYPLLRLPYGAPPGQYPVLLRLYDEQARPSGYELSPAPGARAVLDLPLGVWEIVPGADWARANREHGLPVTVDLTLDGLRLLAHNQTSGILQNGGILRLALLWSGQGALPGLTLAGDGWQVVSSALTPKPSPSGRGAFSAILDWREILVPVDAKAGEARLLLPDGRALASYMVEVLPALYDEPEFDETVGVDFPGVGMLAGFSLDGDSFDRSRDVPVALVWRAGQAAERSYTVFVQLVDADGRVIAQSDSLPVDGSRPTTGWRPGEYLLDAHRLKFHADAAPGPAALIAGLYDAASGQRIEIQPGLDAVTLATGIQVR